MRNKIRDSSQSAAQAQFYTRRNLVSKSVYDGYARLVGTVRDLGYSQSGQAAILVEVQGQEIWMPLSDVAETVDIILLKKGTIIAARDGTVVF
jgi:hypothetical protein